nr:hypothetical protein [Tanacetum cinerariifolium]GFA51690.1 hypothetical protein [Tanacetum cinerariifolium]
MQMHESKIDTCKAMDADLVITECSGTESKVQDDSIRSGNDTDADDADIKPIYDIEPMVEVQLTVECNIFAIGQQHTKQLEIIHEGRVDQKESAFAKPNHIIASSSSRNSSNNMPRFSSNDMVHNHYLEEATTKTQEKDRNSKSSVMHTASPQSTTKVVSKSSAVTTADVSDKRQQQPDSTSSTLTLATTVTADGNFDLKLFLFFCLL